MREIAPEQVISRLQTDNPWWQTPHQVPDLYASYSPRAYLEPFAQLVRETELRRAIVLLGPRRVGKTVMIHHVIQELLKDGVPPGHICYITVDHPIFNGLALDSLLGLYLQANRRVLDGTPTYIFFDEIQYLKDWELHIKAIVDRQPEIRCVVSGSAAAALRMKSRESGAGRLTEFLLPPLTFHEYLELLGKSDVVEAQEVPEAGNPGASTFRAPDIYRLNDHFVDYVNFGGYPEVVLSPAIRADPGRFVKSDIIDKVLLRDLPSLYGIRDVQELNYLFTTLAFNTAGELSLNELSKRSGVTKNTIKRYIEYLEAAFLIKVVERVDHSAKRFIRSTQFKVYLTNPSMRAALFAPVNGDDEAFGSLTETAIFSQWFHHENPNLHYARWADGEIDIVDVGAHQTPNWAVEIKWSDRYPERPSELGALLSFCNRHNIAETTVTTRTLTKRVQQNGITLNFTPASLYCYTVGYNLVKHKRNHPSLAPGTTP